MAEDQLQPATARDPELRERIGELMSGPVKERPPIVVFGDDAVAGVTPPPANDR
jgi:hypothetical protein